MTNYVTPVALPNPSKAEILPLILVLNLPLPAVLAPHLKGTQQTLVHS